MPKIIQICEVFNFSHQNSVACVGDNGKAYMLNRDKMSWEPLPDLPEKEEELFPEPDFKAHADVTMGVK
jgi:hypothetical protein